MILFARRVTLRHNFSERKYSCFFLEGCFMFCRIVTCFTGLAFAGCLFLLAGCEEQNPPPAPPKAEAPKAPAAPAPTPPKTEEPKKTGAVPASPSGAVSAITASATETVKDALKCANGACTQPGLPTKTLAHAGKTLRFCCDDCLKDYKKTNNIQ